MASAACFGQAACPLRDVSIRCRPLAPTNPSSCLRQRHPQRGSPLCAREQEVDVQVFRFTLGIPGFDDANIPRVVGLVGALGMTVNHALGGTPSSAQVIGECIGTVLSAMLIALPSLETRLKRASGGQGRREASVEVPGAIQTFMFDDKLPERLAKELAWTTFAVLRNTNTCTLLIVKGGKVLVARGALGVQTIDAANPRASLPRVQSAVQADIAARPDLTRNLDAKGLFMPDRKAMATAGLTAWKVVPEGAKAAMVIPLSSQGDDFALVLSEYELGLSSRDRQWLRSAAAKAALVCAEL